MRVDTDSTRHAYKVFRCRDGVTKFWSFCSAGAFDGIGQHAHSVITERRQRVRNIPVTSLVGGYKLLYCRRRIVDRVVVGNIVAIQSVAAQIPKLRRVPAIAAKQWHLDVQLFGLFGNHTNLTIVAGNIDHIRILGTNGGELPLVVAIALSIGLLIDNLSAKFLEACFEEFGQAATIRRIEIKHDRRLLCLKCVCGKLGHYIALKRIDEANAEDVVAHLGHCRVGRRW